MKPKTGLRKGMFRTRKLWIRTKDRRKRRTVWLTPRYLKLLSALCGIALFNVWFLPSLEVGPLMALPVGYAAFKLSRAQAWSMAFFAATLWTLCSLSVLPSGAESNARIDFFIRLAVLVAGAEAIGAMRTRLRKESLCADTDYLTGALNKRGFVRRAEQILAEARDQAQTVTLAVIDLDDFKSVNDTHGHHAGDAALRLTVSVLRSELRPGDLVARIGGDEFVVLIPGIRAREAEPIVHRLKSSLTSKLSAKLFPVTFSVGAIAYPRPPKTIQPMFVGADRQMYRIKGSGKNGVQFTISGFEQGKKSAFAA